MLQRITAGFSAKDWALIFLVIFTWGANASAIKLGTTEISANAFLFYRAFFTSLMFLPFITKVSWQDFKNLSYVSLIFFVIHYSVMYLAIDSINSSSFVVLVMLAMPISILLSALFLGEKIGKWTYLGMAICFMGLVTAFGLPDISKYPVGAILCVLTATLWATGSLLMKRTKHINLINFSFYTFAIATPFLFLNAFLKDGIAIFDFKDVDIFILSVSLGYQVIIMGVMASVWGYLIGHHRAEYVAPFLLLQVPVAAICGYFILNEAITPAFVLCGILILSGVGVIHYRRLK